MEVRVGGREGKGHRWSNEEEIPSLHKSVVLPPLCVELSGLVRDREEEQLGLINHNGN